MRGKKEAKIAPEHLVQRPWLWCEVERRALSVEDGQKSVTMSYLGDGVCYARSYSRLHEMAKGLVVVLRDLGIAPYDVVCIDAPMRCETVAAILAIQALGAVSLILPTSLPAERKGEEIAGHKARVLIVETAQNLEQLCLSLGEDAGESSFILMDARTYEEKQREGSCAWPAAAKIVTFEQATLRAEHFKKGFVSRVCDDYPLAYVYTQGSTQRERCVLLNHGMLRLQAEELCHGLGLQHGCKILCDCVLANATALAVISASIYASGQCIWYVPDESLLETIAVVQAEVLFFIPAHILALQTALLSGGDALRDRWLQLCSSASKFMKRNKTGWLGWTKPLLHHLFTQRFHEALGEQLRKVVSYGNLFDSRAAEFLSFLEIESYNAYSFSDVGGFAHVHAFNGAGGYLRCFEHRIEEGELFLRYKKIAGNWQATHDQVFEDERCGLCVRRLCTVELSTGEQVDVTALEDILRRDPLIEEIFVFGRREPFLCALIYLNEAALNKWAQEHNLLGQTFYDLSQSPLLYGHIQSIVEQHNFTRASFETIRKLALLPIPLSKDERTLTATRLTRRYEVENRYAQLLRSFYVDVF